MSETPLPNQPEARTPTGEIKDVSLETTQTASSQTTSETKQEPSTTKTAEQQSETAKTETAKDPNAPPTSLLNKEETEAKKDEPPKAPDKYEPFTVPEGYELNEEVATKAQTIFKELNLPQDAAQKLVDFYSEQVKSIAEAPAAAFAETTKAWADATMADPTLGPRIKEVQANIGRALSTLGDAKLVSDFRSVMDMTGAGSHPAFVKAFDKLAAAVLEGRPVPQGGGPSRFGQVGPNGRPATLASAIYPTLPSG